MIELLIALTLMMQGSPAASSVEGFVVQAGTNPPQVLVNARLEIAGVGEPRIARSDSTGRFAFSNLSAGVYTLSVTKDGYLRKEPGIRVELKPNQAIKDIVFRLDSAPTIEGMIRDPEGLPLFNVTVQGLRVSFDARGQRRLSLFSSTRTDDRGMFRLYWLDPGEYFLSATAPPPPPKLGNTVGDVGTAARAAAIQAPVAFAPTYFPGFVDIDEAKSIRLDRGRDLTGMDFSLVRQAPATLTGYVTSLTKGPVVTRIDVTPPSDGAGVSRYQGQSDGFGAFTIRGVVPGMYIVSSTAGNETSASRIRIRFAQQGGRGASSQLRVDLRIGPGVTISGRFGNTAQTPMDLRDAGVQLTEIDDALPRPKAAAIAPDGAFTIAAVQPGTYSVSVSGLPGDLYLKNASFRGADALAKPFPIDYASSESTSSLMAEIGTDGGRIAGAVFDEGNAPLPGAQVVLVPEAASRFRFDRFRTTITDQDGRFVIRGIAPGDYTLFGWSSIEPNAHLDVEYMRPYESFGTPVHITPGENPAVGLRALQSDR